MLQTQGLNSVFRLMSGHFNFQVTLSELIYNILPLGYKYRFTHCHFHGKVVKLKYFHKLCRFQEYPKLSPKLQGIFLICIKAITHQHLYKVEKMFLFLKGIV